MSDTTQRGLSRRSVTRLAAWSVPAVAVVAAAPAQAASVGTAFDVQVTTECSFTLLNLNGLRRFVVTSLSGTVPAGSTFQLTATGALGLTLGQQLGGLVVSQISGQTATLTLPADLPSGSSAFVDLSAVVLSVGVIVQYTLTYLASPSGTESGPGANSGNLTLVGAAAGGANVLTVCTGP